MKRRTASNRKKMIESPKRPESLFAILLALLFLTGCRTSKEEQLHRVAKDWCMTIRASQVIPVYPLTEDLQPGDVFLVQVPVDKQQRIYNDKGFLPLDNHIARLNPGGYNSFYRNSFLARSTNSTLPGDWQRPQLTNLHSWQSAPHAAFPTFSFSVRSGQGLNLAVPIQGVPVGLSLLNSDAADGSVAIRQARTIGIDTVSLYEELQAWALTNADFLRHYGAGLAERKTNFLRAVTRIYVTGEMDVSLRDVSSKSSGLDVGAAKPVNLLFPELPKDASNRTEVVARNYTNGWNALESMLTKATEAAKDGTGKFLPGGSLRLAGASSRSVALKEQFDPPVILGYLGFDCAIYKGGFLGPPIPTHAVLSTNANLGERLQMNPFASIYSQAVRMDIYEMLDGLKATNVRASNAVAALDALQKFIPGTFTGYGEALATNKVDYVLRATPHSANAAATGFENYTSFQGRLTNSIHEIDRALRRDVFHYQEGKDAPLTEAPRNSPVRKRLQEEQKKYIRMLDNMAETTARRKANAAAFAAYLDLMTQ